MSDTPGTIPIGITDHIEGSRLRPSAQIYEEISQFVTLADQLGVRYTWFAEHHAHIHEGHLPTPLLLALHLAGRTKQIQLGTAIICLNLHHPIDVAEQVAVADVLSGGRMAVGFGSGSAPEESKIFGLDETSEAQRHARFEQALGRILSAWESSELAAGSSTPPSILPRAAADLPSRCWLAVNSLGAAQIAGKFNFNMLFSHLKTPADYQKFSAAYRSAGGHRLIAANRPIYVGSDDDTAYAEAEPALRILWRRFQKEGKIPATVREPTSPPELCGHPLNFLVGSPATVARSIFELRRQVHFDVINIEVRWEGLPHALMLESLRRFVTEAMPRNG